MQLRLPFFTLVLLISFASVNAVLFTPALPAIASFFDISEDRAQQTLSIYLVGYTFGQLLYGPLANRFGRKKALYAGISLQILSSLLACFAGTFHQYWLLIAARFLQALGSGVGLKMTFTLVNECYTPKLASQKISYLMLAFALTPGLGVALGGILNSYYGWTSCFYAAALYGLLLLGFVSCLPETQKSLNLNALKIKPLLQGYISQFKNKHLVSGGILMGCATCFVYVFAALAPFIAINIFNMNSTAYGLANLLPSLGLLAGSFLGAKWVKSYSLTALIQAGILFAALGVLVMFIALLLHTPVLFSIFLPMILIYFGLCLVLANASTLALSQVNDKAEGSAVMNFINMGLATLLVTGLSFLPIKTLMLPVIYLVLCAVLVKAFKIINSSRLEKWRCNEMA